MNIGTDILESNMAITGNAEDVLIIKPSNFTNRCHYN